jgi:hypothetical protein
LTEYVYVPVPSEMVDPVYRLLAGVDPITHTDTPPASAPDASGIPDPDLVRRMYRESHQGHKRLMALLAEAPDEWTYTAEIATELALPHGSRGLAGMLGAFGRRSKNRYGHQKPWITEWDGQRGEAQHMMPGEVAEVIASLLPEK